MTRKCYEFIRMHEIRPGSCGAGMNFRHSHTIRGI